MMQLMKSIKMIETISDDILDVNNIEEGLG
jgi:hypothetical protein